MEYENIQTKEIVLEKDASRYVKEAIYQANLESINSTKLKLRILENQLNREWGQAKNV